MRMTIDQDADALYIRFDEAKIVEAEEVSDGIILDFDANGRSSVWKCSTFGSAFPTPISRMSKSKRRRFGGARGHPPDYRAGATTVRFSSRET